MIPWRHVALLFGLWLVVLACGDDDQSRSAPPVVCEDDAGCESGRCDPRRGCVECLFDTDCEAGERCLDRSCKDAIVCDASEDCAGSAEPVCNLATSYCVECASDADCPGRVACRTGVCDPNEPCRSAADCSEGRRCAPDSRTCVECVSDTDCGSSSRQCVEQRCVTRCDRDADCPDATPLCTPSKHCAECRAQSDCPDVYHCAGGACELDVCKSGAKRCQADRAAVLTCSPAGDKFAPSACSDASLCVEGASPASSEAEGDEPRCEARPCAPDTWYCESARIAVHCAADGSVEERFDCSEMQRICKDGQCRAPVCTAGEVRCVEGDLYRCDSDGLRDALIESCQPGTECDAGQQACVLTECAPGMAACDGDRVVTCREDGSGFEPEGTDCSESGEICWEGACAARECAADQCRGQDSYRCVDGLRLVLEKTCDPLGSPAEFCNPETGGCEDVRCAPLTPTCNREIATACLEDGSGPAEDGIDCAASGDACWDGVCLPRLCSEPFVCAGVELLRCENNGTVLLLESTCDRADLCDDVTGTCALGVCTPGVAVCDGTVAGVCAESGEGLAVGAIDCAESGQGCLDGECKARLCTAGELLCVGDDVHRCNASEVATVLVDACQNGEHCIPGEASCVINQCSPGAAICTGNRATTCREDGSGPVASGGVDCAATDQVCHLGTCRSLVCPPGIRYCQNGNVRLCSANGLASGPYDNCLPEEHCDPEGGSAAGSPSSEAACVRDQCNHGAPTCDGEVLATCNADGSGYAMRGADCAVSNQVCDLTGQCLAVANDTIGGTAFSFEAPVPTLYVSVLDVFMARRLESLAIYLGVAANTELDFAVYEAQSTSGPFTLVFERSLMANGAATGALQRVDGLNVELQASRYYAVAALIHAPHTVFQGETGKNVLSFAHARGENSVTYVDQTVALPASLSLGTLREPATRIEVESRAISD